jgi:DNA-binding MarR family transcriptional regulator
LRLGRLVEKAIEVTSTACGFIVSGDYEVLATLRRAYPDLLQPAALAERTMITNSGMTGRLDRLEGAGLIERRQNLLDRRAVDIFITPRGRDSADQAFQEITKAVSAILVSLTPDEVARLADLLRTPLADLGDVVPSSA